MRKRTSIEHDIFFLLFILGSRLQNRYSNVDDEINDVQYVSVTSISLHLQNFQVRFLATRERIQFSSSVQFGNR